MTKATAPRAMRILMAWLMIVLPSYVVASPTAPAPAAAAPAPPTAAAERETPASPPPATATKPKSEKLAEKPAGKAVSPPKPEAPKTPPAIAPKPETPGKPLEKPTEGEENVATEADDLLVYLDQVIGWQRSIAATLPSASNPRGALIRDALLVNATKLLRLSFDFTRARALTLDVRPSERNEDDEETRTRQDFEVRAAAADQHLSDMHGEMDTLARELRTTRQSARRQAIRERQQTLVGQMKIATAQQELRQTIKGFWKESDSNELGEQIEALARTVPDMQTSASKKTPAPVALDAMPKAEEDDTDGSGLLGLGKEMYGFSRKKAEIDELGRQAEAIRQSNEAFGAALRAEFQLIVEQGNAIAVKLGRTEGAAREAQQQQMDLLLGRFRVLSRAVSPLAESNVWLDSSVRNVRDWKRSLDREFRRDFYNFAIRLGVLGFMVLVPLAIGEFVRRATKRYVRDLRRKRQVGIIRRVLVTLVICLVILLSLVTEFGSLATFAGFLTAGIAVALQNVILSVVAYFFYFSRYGVRVGNRVTIGGTIGEVVEIGLVRLHLMELDGDHLNAHPTGQIVSFPNSVLFQPAPFSKRLSGTDYAWHELSITFAPDTDDQQIESRMKQALDSVYADYEELARPVTALEQATHAMVPTPRPRATLGYSNDGLTYHVRYPVESERSSTIDYRLARALLTEAAKSPPLVIVAKEFAK